MIVLRYPAKVGDTTSDTINASQYHGKDSAGIEAYNKGYLKIKIKVGRLENDYEFRYMGDEQQWKTSPGSAIFISEAHDKGLSQDQAG